VAAFPSDTGVAMHVSPRSTARRTVGPCAAGAVVAALFVVAAAASSPAIAPAAEPPRDWSQVLLAQNDPRAVSDAPLPVDPVPTRRLSRRAQRRNLRRGIPEPVAPPTERFGVPVASEPAFTDQIETAPPPAEMPAAARVIVHRDQPSIDGGHPRQRFDIRLPEGCTGAGLPLVVWIHGPDWRTGSKAECPIAWLVDRGYAVASVGYRTSDVAVFPAQLDDCRAAVTRLVADAEVWGIDPARVCVAGSGAGGHLAALVGYAPHDTGPIRAASTDTGAHDANVPAAVVVIDAPVHLTTLGPAADRGGSAASRLVGGPLPEFREAAQHASPLVHVSADDPPTLIVHGGRGSAVPADQATRLDRALETAGVERTLLIIEDAAAATPTPGSRTGDALERFLERTIGPGAARAAGE
jgi:acetyl esterase/lipase